jgi:hypothetical protein
MRRELWPNKSLEPKVRTNYELFALRTAAPFSGVGLLLRKTLAEGLRQCLTCAAAQSNARLPFHAAGSSRCGSAYFIRQQRDTETRTYL